jgi:hypothetical protein
MCDSTMTGCCCLNDMGSKIKALMWPHRKKSIGVRSGNLGDQATGLPHPIQRSLLSGSEKFSDLTGTVSHRPIVLELHISLECQWDFFQHSGSFSSRTPSKSVHWAVGVTSKAQSKSHAQCPPRLMQSVVGGSEQTKHEGLLHGSCGCWKSYVNEKFHLLIASWFWWESLRQQQLSSLNLAILSAHINLCSIGISNGCVSRWMPVCLNIWSHLVTNYNFFFYNTSMVLLDFQP